MILVGGENLIDFIEEPGDGGHPVYRAWPGGGPFNAAKAIGLQGGAVGYLAPFSTDPLGRFLKADLCRISGIEALAPDSTKPTTLAVVSLVDGQAQYQFYREGTAERDVTPDALIAAGPSGAKAFVVGTLALADGPDAEAWAALWGHCHESGLFTALDPNIRPAFIHDRPAYEARLERLVATADLLKLSDEDIAWLAPNQDPVEAARALAGRSSAGLTVLTLGAEGAVGFAGGAEVRVPAHPVAALVDTVGAGDTFMGTLVAEAGRQGRLARGGMAGLGAAEAKAWMARAAQAAAINCERPGCQPPTLAELTGAYSVSP